MAVYATPSSFDELAPLDAVLRDHVIAVLAACHGNRTVAARTLDIDRKTIYRMLLRWQVDAAPPALAPHARASYGP